VQLFTPGEKTEHYSYELKTTFRHLPISSHAFFVTIRPNEAATTETLLIRAFQAFRALVYSGIHVAPLLRANSKHAINLVREFLETEAGIPGIDFATFRYAQEA
jgi:hypothetical protein